MARVSKPPEVRKQEIIETAMKLFYTNGYEETSMEDIANEMKVVKGLCYRYFKSKKELFDVVMDHYVTLSVAPFQKIIRDGTLSIKQRVNLFVDLAQKNIMAEPHQTFFHKQGNESFHEQLIMKIARALELDLSSELSLACKKGELTIEDIEFTTKFILYGQMALWENQISANDKRFEITRKFILQILGLQ